MRAYVPNCLWGRSSKGGRAGREGRCASACPSVRPLLAATQMAMAPPSLSPSLLWVPFAHLSFFTNLIFNAALPACLPACLHATLVPSE